MSSHGIVVHDVWKKFRRGELHDSLRDLVPALTKRLLGRAPSKQRLGGGEFWAVRDVSFEVKPGEALGIIGPNGAGKSTMLKLLTKILRPTRGQIEVRGRVAALIEIAGGFHGDLTGRENVYLQGAILGMKNAEIRRRFDQIVEFSAISDFIDTPVKRYSTGMNARLGFSIAVHLEPDVLIIDEVLAVGDFAFQAKAFDRIRELVTKSGIPVVLVSHQLDRVASLCTRAMLLNKGGVVHEGPPADCISAYVLGELRDDRPEANGSPVVFQSATVTSAQPVPSGGRVQIQVSASVVDPKAHKWCGIAVRVRDFRTGRVLSVADTTDSGIELPPRGSFEVDIELDLNVPPGLYSAEIIVRDVVRKRPVSVGPALTIQVKEGPGFWGTVQMNARMRLKELPAGIAHTDSGETQVC